MPSKLTCLITIFKLSFSTAMFNPPQTTMHECVGECMRVCEPVCVCLCECMHMCVCVCVHVCGVCVYMTVVNVTVKLSGLPPHVEDGCYTNPFYYHDYYFMAPVRCVSLLPVAEGRCCCSACAWQEPPGRACTRGCWEHPAPAPHSPLPSSPAPPARSTICSQV